MINDYSTKNIINELDLNNNNIQRQLFALNSMSTNELKLKWLELYKTPALNFKKGFLIKGIAYKMQMLAGLSNISQEELSLSLNIAKDKLKISNKNSLLNRQVNILPPTGSVIKSVHKNIEYIVKVVDDGSNGNSPKFEYNSRIYKSLSAIATEITGTRWNGYTFFKLKKNIKAIKKINNK